MDAGGLTILLKEMEADCAVAREAANKAAQRLKQESPGHLEACAYELSRFYKVVERMFERICEEFENHFEKRGDFHERLIQRLALHLEGICPAFIPKDRTAGVRELKGFRHVMRHAYDLTLRADRLAEELPGGMPGGGVASLVRGFWKTGSPGTRLELGKPRSRQGEDRGRRSEVGPPRRDRQVP